jgi:hypothetical protein
MATKPTREQERAADLLAQTLLTIAEAARLDSRGSLDERILGEIAERLVRASSAFDVNVITNRALEVRGRSLGLRSGCSDLLGLFEDEVRPFDLLLKSDDQFKALIARLEEELGDV